MCLNNNTAVTYIIFGFLHEAHYRYPPHAAQEPF